MCTHLQILNIDGTRELIADDFVYEIKRLADPAVQSPIYGLMSQHIVGLQNWQSNCKRYILDGYIDLRKYPLEGVTSNRSLSLSN